MMPKWRVFAHSRLHHCFGRRRWGIIVPFYTVQDCRCHSNCPLKRYYYFITLQYIGLLINHITKHLKSCVNNCFYSFVNVKVIFQNTWHMNSFFLYKDRLNRLHYYSKPFIELQCCCWDCYDFYFGKIK